MTTLPSPEPYYSMTRRAGDLLFLSGFGPVENRVLVDETIEEYTYYTMDDAAYGRGLVVAGAAWLLSIVARIPSALELRDRLGAHWPGDEHKLAFFPAIQSSVAEN